MDAAGKLNILLVDDRPDKSAALSSVLEELNQNLILVHSGKEALKQLLEKEFALVLLDVHMPIMDGYETASLIRGRPGMEKLPIIFVTGADPSELQLARGYSLGAVDFIFSPVNRNIIQAKVSAILELHRKAKNLETLVQHKTAALLESQERYRLLVENAKDFAIFFMDTEGRITEWNPGAERILGWPESEVLGRQASLIFTPEDIANGAPEKELKEAAEGKNAFDDRWHVRKDKSRFWASGRMVGLHGNDGKLLGFAKILRDFTERKRQNDAMRVLVEERETLNELGKVFAAELDTQKLVQAVTDAATRLVNAQFGAFFYNIIDEKGESYSLYTISGVPREMFSKFPMPRNTEVFGPTFMGQGIVRSGDITKDPRYGKNAPYHGMPKGHLPVKSYLAAPVASRSGVVLGGLFFGHAEPDIFTEREERLVAGLAAQAAVALDNAQLFGTVQRERTAAQVSEERYRTLSELIPQIVWTARPDGWRDYFNRRWFDFTGLTLEQTQGSGWEGVIHPEDLPKTLDTWKHSVATGAPFEIEYRFKRHDGIYRWHISRAIALRDKEGNITKWFGASTDIDDQKRTEREIQEARKQLSAHATELEQTVADRTVKLRETIGELEAFSYSISHDMRAPLRAMEAYARALGDDYGDQIPEEGKSYLSRIQSAAIRLDTLITDVLAYSRILRAPVSSTPVDVAELLKEIIEHYPTFQPPQSDIEIEGPLPKVMGHEASLTQCFTNLIGNAVKFVPAGTVPKVNIWAEPREREIRLWFQDNGIGIAPQNQRRIFEIFQQIHPEGHYDGTGIGLAIVRKAVERMGGTFGLESEEGKGSRFWIQLKKA